MGGAAGLWPASFDLTAWSREVLPWTAQRRCEHFHVRGVSISRLPVVPKNRQRRTSAKPRSWSIAPSTHANGVVSEAETKCDPRHPLETSSNQRWDRAPPVCVRAH